MKAKRGTQRSEQKPEAAPDAANRSEEPLFFETPEDLRRWFQEHHADAGELHVGYHKKDSGRRSITWPESVDEALCVGWIDGVRRSLGERTYKVRFTPRRAASTWSAVNIARVAVLTAEGRMQPTGLLAFQARQESRSRIYAYEQPGHKERLTARPVELDEPYAAILRQNPVAWEYFQTRRPSDRRRWCQWVLDAKAEATRLRRLEKLIAACAEGKSL